MTDLVMPLPENITEVLKRLSTAGYPAYAVGGCVRDAMRGVLPHDYDITTGALPQEVKAVFSDLQVIETGISHGTVTVLCGSEPVEITTFRVDGEYLDNRHPSEVRFTRSLADDLSRRDFTVNAMAYSPTDGLTDLFGGAAHLKQRVIACVGDPDTRFNEDGLRILRALRFASVLDFSIASETARAIHGNRRLLLGISRERIYAELSRLLCGAAAGAVVLEYSDVLGTVIPPLEGCTQWLTISKALPLVPAEAPLRYALLLHTLGGDAAREALRSLRADNRTALQAVRLISGLSAALAPTRTCARMLARQLGYEDARSLITLRCALALAADPAADCALYDELARQLQCSERDADCVTLSALAVSGSDLSALGLSGPEIGKTLEALLTLVIEDKAENRRDALLGAARGLIGHP